jgi:hypothetical protein
MDTRERTGLGVVHMVLHWREHQDQGDKEGDPQNDEDFLPALQQLDFSSFRPKTRDALNGFVDAVVHDYVK